MEELKCLRSLETLTKIVFDGCEFKCDPMPALGGLNHLAILVLLNDAIAVDEISCPGPSFKRLKSEDSKFEIFQ